MFLSWKEEEEKKEKKKEKEKKNNKYKIRTHRTLGLSGLRIIGLSECRTLEIMGGGGGDTIAAILEFSTASFTPVLKYLITVTGKQIINKKKSITILTQAESQ